MGRLPYRKTSEVLLLYTISELYKLLFLQSTLEVALDIAQYFSPLPNQEIP
jgi:hypothetical protein